MAGDAAKTSAVGFDSLLDCSIQVTAVDRDNHATKISVTVDRCLRDGKPLLAKGAVIVAAVNGNKVEYSVNGAAVEKPLAECLDLTLQNFVSIPNQKDDEESMFGTDQRKKVGDVWAVHQASVANMMSVAGFVAKKELVTGETKLVGIKTVGGKDILEIEGHAAIDGLKGVALGTSSSVSLKFSGMFPENPADKPLNTSMGITSTTLSTNQTDDHKVITVNVTFERTVTVTLK